jgi:hypothetical protein
LGEELDHVDLLQRLLPHQGEWKGIGLTFKGSLWVCVCACNVCWGVKPDNDRIHVYVVFSSTAGTDDTISFFWSDTKLKIMNIVIDYGVSQ